MRGNAQTLRVAGLIAVMLVSGCSTLGRSDERSLAGKTVVVTGASSGFGRGTAVQLAARGANVVLAARRTGLLEEVAREAGGNTLVVTTDVGREADVERLAREAIGRFGRIDVWINDAGIAALGRFEEVPLEDHLRVLDVNLRGAIYGSYFAMRHFREQGRGTLINIASVAGRIPQPYYASYVASKHALVGFGATLNQELRANGVRDIHVVTINPYAADTPFFEHAANYSGHAPRSVWLDRPEKVVDAIVGATMRPRPEINVGFKANAAVASHRLSRRLTQAAAGRIFHRVQMEEAPPAPATAGSLHEPMQSGRQVGGGVIQRMAVEEAQKEQAESRRR